MLLEKIVTAGISPLGTSLVLAVIGLVLLSVGRDWWRRPALGVLWLAIIWLFVWSTPLASFRLRAALESDSGPRHIGELPQVDAIVVFGGGIQPAESLVRPLPDLLSASDREWHAARLYHARKAERIIVSAGPVRPGGATGAEAMANFLVDLGVPRTAITLEPQSRNTRENAIESAKLLRKLGVRRAILVTSALHMRRARAALEREGVEVVAAPTDFEGSGTAHDLLEVLPSAKALEVSSRAAKELVGSAVARLTPLGRSGSDR